MPPVGVGGIRNWRAASGTVGLVGQCPEFGAVIVAGCDHRMRPEESSCVCPGCGTRCEGLFRGCPEVWASRSDDQPISGTPTRARPTVAPTAAVRPPAGKSAPRPSAAPPPAKAVPPLVKAVPPQARAETLVSKVETGVASAQAGNAKAEAAVRKQKDAGIRLRAEADAMREALERSFERMAAELADRAREIDARAREIDVEAAAQLREIEHARASMPAEVRKSIAGVLPGLVAESVRIAIDSRRQDQPSPASIAEEVQHSIAASLPAMVADAVDDALGSRAADPTEDRPEGGLARPEHRALAEARQRSLEHRIDGLTRRHQEIDDRITDRLRALDDDRVALAELVRRQDELARAVADAAEHNSRLVAWVDDAVPARVAASVESALKVHGASLRSSLEQVDRARADTETLGRTIQESSERLMETLYRRDQEVEERSGAHLRALEEERAALAALLENGRDQVAKLVIRAMPAMVDAAVRTAMERHAAERREPALEMANRLRADADIMRETLQRSFEKMMESLATREHELADAAAAHGRKVDHDKGELGELRASVANSLTETLPAMVADSVRTAEEEHRETLEAARNDMARLRTESEATAAELREAVADLRAAALAQRSEAVERQAAASVRALEDMRSAMARPTAGVARANGGPRAVTPPPPPPQELPTEPLYELETVGDEVSIPERPLLGKSSVPRSRRVERRLLKIDDRDDEPWRPLDRRQAALSDLLDGDDAERTGGKDGSLSSF